MAKRRRTKSQKISSQARSVKGQFGISFTPGMTKADKTKKVEKSEESKDLGSIKKDLTKSLIIASLMLGSILMLYWFSQR